MIEIIGRGNALSTIQVQSQVVNESIPERLEVSAALRKKIFVGNGVPPTVIRMREFWHELGQSVQTWTLEALDFESSPKIGTFSVISGQDAANLLESPFSYFFNAEQSPGLCAITIDSKCAVQGAAIRLGQDATTLEEATLLFIKLLGEQPACALWKLVCSDLPGHKVDADIAPVPDHEMVSGAFEEKYRYLQVAASFSMAKHETWIKFLFDLRYLQQRASEASWIESDRRAQALAKSPRSLTASVWASPVKLDAVIDRMSLSIGACSRLEVGNVLELPDIGAEKLALWAETVTGNIEIGVGEIGVFKRQRAVKLKNSITDTVAREIVEL